jgi:predicted permease|eukprot:g7045.t1
MELLSVFLSALSTVVTILLLNLLGIGMSHYKLLTQRFLKQLAGLSSKVFLPSLIFTGLSKGLTLEKLMLSGLLPFFAILHIGIAAAVGYFARLFVKPSKEFWTPFLCACAFHNSSALPLVITTALATQHPFSNDPNAFEKMSTYIFLYVTGWGILFWCCGYTSLLDSARTVDLTETVDAEQPSTGKKNQVAWGRIGAALKKGFVNPPMIMTFVGIVVGITPALKELFHGERGAPLGFVASAILILGQPATGIVTLVIAGTLGGTVLDKIKYIKQNRKQLDSITASKELDQHVNPLVVAGTHSKGEAAIDSQPPKAWPVKVLLWLCFFKLVVIGGIQFGVTAWLVPLIFPADADPFLKLVLLIEASALPSANLNLVICQQAGNKEAAETLSLAYILMYIGMLITLVVYLSLALYIVF